MAKVLSIRTEQVKGTETWVTEVRFLTEYLPAIPELRSLIERRV